MLYWGWLHKNVFNFLSAIWCNLPHLIHFQFALFKYGLKPQTWNENKAAFWTTYIASPTSFPVFISFQIWLGEGSIHHLPVARPNEVVVCLPNGTWAPSVIGKPMQRHAAFTLPALVCWQRGDHVRPYPVRVSLYACCEIPVTTLLCNMASCTRPAECFWPRESVPLPPCHSSPMWLGQGVWHMSVLLECGVGVRRCSSTAGAGLSGLS